MATKRADRARARRALDERAQRLAPAAPRPAGGWVRSVREALGMSTSDLARRVGITQQRVDQIERSELTGALKVETLERVAAALDCTLVYALVPNRSLDEVVREQARRKAERHLSAVRHSMVLEDQEVASSRHEEQLDELAQSLIDKPRLWADE